MHFRLVLCCSTLCPSSCADPEEGTGGRTRLHPPWKITKTIVFLSNSGPDPLQNHKATKPAFNVWPLSAASETPLNGVSLAGR